MKSDEFVREVDEAVRRDRWLSLWQHYRAYVIGTAIAIVVGTAAGVGWRQLQEAGRLDEAREFAEAEQLLAEGRPAEAAVRFSELADSADTGFTVLARLRQAEAEGLAGNPEPKREALRTLAEDDDAPATFRTLAKLLEAQLELAQGNTEAAAAFNADGSEARHWQSSAKELAALAKLERGETEAARNLLDELIETEATPASLRERARELRASLGATTSDAAEAAPGHELGGAAAER